MKIKDVIYGQYFIQYSVYKFNYSLNPIKIVRITNEFHYCSRLIRVVKKEFYLIKSIRKVQRNYLLKYIKYPCEWI